MKNLFRSIILFLIITSAFSQWAVQQVPITQNLYCIEMINTDNGYAAGETGKIIKTTNGTSWIQVSSPTQYGIYDMKFFGMNTGWIIVFDDYQTRSWEGQIFKTTDGGMNWVLQYSDSVSNLTSCYFLNLNTGYVPHNGWSTGQKSLLKTTNGGTNWQKIFITNDNGYWGDIYFLNENTGYISGTESRMFKTTNGGLNWNIVSGLNYYYDNFFIIDNNNIWSAVSTYITRTTNGGDTWVLSAQIGNKFWIRDICFPVANKGFTVGIYGKIYYTTNGGESWATLAPVVKYQLHEIEFPDINTGYIVGEFGTILKTTNGGLP